MRKKLLTIYAKEYIMQIETTQMRRKEVVAVVLMPYSNLKAEMAKKDITIEAISKTLDIHRNSVANKLQGKSAFSIEEAVKIQRNYFPDKPLKYLFDRT